MKHRILSSLLVLSLFLGATICLSSCGDGSKESEGLSQSESMPDDEKNWYDRLNFKKTLTVSQSVNVWDSVNSIPNAERYTRGPEEIGSDEVLNMCYTRNREVSSALGLTIKYTETNYRYNQILPYLDQLAVMAVSPVDLVINDWIVVKNAMLKGHFYNLKDQTEQNYFNFEHDSWYNDFMDGLTYDNSRYYAMAGDYFFDVIRSGHCLYVNTEVFEIQLSDYYDNIKEFYTMISEGEAWTYDHFSDLIAAGWKSTSGSAYANPDDEYVGLWIGSEYPFTMGAAVQLYEKTDTGYALVENIAELSSWAQEVCELWNGDGVYCATSSDDGRGRFVEGGILFSAGFWLGDLEYPTYYAMEKKAPIVYPKWSEAVSNYTTWVHDSAEIGYIMKNTDDFTPTSAYCQLLSEKSVAAMHSYYEYALKYKNNTDPEALGMIDLIRNSIMSPFSLYMTGGAQLLSYKSYIVNNNPAAIATQYQSKRPDYVKAMNSAIEKFNALED